MLGQEKWSLGMLFYRDDAKKMLAKVRRFRRVQMHEDAE